MRFYVVCIGKLKDAYLREGVAGVCETYASLWWYYNYRAE